MRLDLAVHIIAGAVGIATGFVALSVAKGATTHRTSGMTFVYAMITMGLVGSTMAIVRNVAPGANAPVGLLTAYLVITGFTTVHPRFARSRRLHVVFMAVVLVALGTLASFGVQAATSPTGKLYGMPSFPFFMFASIASLGLVGDVRVLRSGGLHTLRGAPRLTRHLWRMCTALLIAAFSFFLGQAKVIPKPFRVYSLLVIPPLLVLGALLYWLWRIRLRRSLRGIVVARIAQAA